MTTLYRAVCVVLFFCVAWASCSGPPAREPDALYRAYHAPLGQVYEAARLGFQRLELVVSEESADQRYLKGVRYGEVVDGGETVHVWLDDLGGGATGVWIDTVKAGWVWRGAFVDWSPKLLDRISRVIEPSMRRKPMP